MAGKAVKMSVLTEARCPWKKKKSKRETEQKERKEMENVDLSQM